MRRAFRKSSRGGPRRKLHWESSALFLSNGNMENGDVVSFVPRFPAGSVTSQGYDIRPDATLVRTIVDGINVTNTQDGTGPEVDHVYFFAAGLIAWDMDPDYAAFLDGSVGPPADVGIPDPVNGSYDWIWRWTGTGAVLTSSQFLFAQPISDRQQESKAQRKLSSGTGLLFCFSWNDFQGAGATSDMSMDFGTQLRMLYKDP